MTGRLRMYIDRLRRLYADRAQRPLTADEEYKATCDLHVLWHLLGPSDRREAERETERLKNL